MKQHRLPLNLQFFADSSSTGTQGNEPLGNEPQNQPGTSDQQNKPEFDYEKIANIVAGKQSVTEDTVLKSYFKQQGLSKEEAEQAMTAFKTERAKNQPDVNAIQTQLTQAQALAQKEAVEKAAVLEAVSIGLDAKSIPYVLKMADFAEAVGQDGKPNTELLKNAINKVLEDIPQLKPTQETQKGFQIGGSGQQPQDNQSGQLSAIFGNSK